MSLRASIATPDGKAPYVRRLFATVADRYDLITVLLSYGQDRRWKRRLLEMAGPLEGRRAIDLACGTGDIAFGAAAGGAAVIGLDLTPRMIQLAREKAATRRLASRPVTFVVGDMMRLPFASGSCDVLTTGYGLRNVPQLVPAIQEIARVVRPGGLFLSLDFNRPRSSVVRAAYLAYLSAVGSAAGFALHGDADTYRYIAESLRTYPGADAIVGLLGANGFSDVAWRPVLGGLLAIHVARRDAGT
jgi:demethylmenaquinone methyltransferase / 2-methoxy-6-polyprenyl-1,4-benzoquinol methylase